MSVTTFQYINLDYLEQMSDGDAEMMQTMIEMLLVEIPEEIEKMQHCVTTNDWEELFQLSHKMKTTLAFIGNEEMISINKTIEHCSRHKVDLPEVPKMVQQVAELAKPALVELQQVSI
jgi:HPt (histidine-containing phosphotransfer) domain-containing protein